MRPVRLAPLLALALLLAGCAGEPVPAPGGSRDMPPPSPVPSPVPSPEPSPVPSPAPTPQVTPANRTSILPNGGFEGGAGVEAFGWALDFGAQRECGVDPRAGECAARLPPGGQARADINALPAGSLVWLELFTMGGRAQLKATLQAWNGPQGLGSESELYDLEFGWRYHLLGPFLVPEGASVIQVILSASGDNDTRVDEVAVYTAEPVRAALRNGGFEAGDGIAAEAWDRHNAYRDCTRGIEGMCSMRLEHAAGSRIAQSFGPRGETLRLSFARQTEGEAQVWANLTFYAPDGTVTGRSGGASTNAHANWETSDTGQSIPASTSRIKLVLEAGYAEGAISWIDDVRIDWGGGEAPPPPTPPPRAGDDVVVNGGFEEGDDALATGWTQRDAVRDTSRASGGCCSMRLRHAASPGFAAVEQTYDARDSLLSVGLQRYSSGGSVLWINGTFLNAEGAVVGTASAPAWDDGGRWYDQSAAMAVPQHAERVVLSIQTGYGPDVTTWIDDVRVRWVDA